MSSSDRFLCVMRLVHVVPELASSPCRRFRLCPARRPCVALSVASWPVAPLRPAARLNDAARVE
eukprot:5278502-Pyramimonas_sp.AAC.1